MQNVKRINLVEVHRSGSDTVVCIRDKDLRHTNCLPICPASANKISHLHLSGHIHIGKDDVCFLIAGKFLQSGNDLMAHLLKLHV